MLKRYRNSKRAYFFITSLASGGLLLLLPLFVNLLGVEEYGLFSLYVAISSWFAFFATLGSPTKIRKNLAYKTEFLYSDIYFEMRLVYLLFIFSMLVLAVATFFCDISWSDALIVAAFSAAYIANQSLASCRLGVGDMLLAGIQNGVYCLLPLVAVLLLGWDSWSSRFCFSVVVVLVILWFNRSCFLYNIPEKDTGETLLQSLIDSLKISLNGLFDKLVSQGDKLFVGAVFGLEVLGVYALGAQISNVVHLAMKSFTVFVEKGIFSKDSNAKAELLLLVVLSLVFVFVLYFFTKQTFLFFFDEVYLPVLQILLVQMLVVWARVLQGLIFTHAYVLEKHGVYSLVQYGAMIVIVGITYFLNGWQLLTFCISLLLGILVGVVVNVLFMYLSTSKKF